MTVNVTTAAVPAPAPSADREALFWSSIKDGTDPAGFEAYLKQYPSGTFAALARQRLAGLTAKPPALDPARFDGTWNVTIECEPYKAAAGYRLQFLAQVKDGVIDAQNGVTGEPSSLTMSGKISADGNGSVAVRGLTGNPTTTLNREARGTSYGYRANLRFEGSRGSGNRVEARPCTLTFVR